MLHAPPKKNINNRSNIMMHLINTLKMVHIKKIFFNLKNRNILDNFYLSIWCFRPFAIFTQVLLTI